jgi:hypothetical protein
MNRKRDTIVMAAIIVIVGIVLFAAFVVPYLANRPLNSPINSCRNNLRQIDGATQGWAMKNHKDTNAVPTWNDILPYMKYTPKCPSGGNYTLGSLSRMPTCSIPEHLIP